MSKMSNLILYIEFMSPCTRAVLMVGKELGLEFEQKPTNFLKGEHLTPEFLELSPAHTIPVLIDGDTKICDSHSIIMYLADKYGKSDKLYPKDLHQRSLVNTKLIFEAMMFERHRQMLYPIIAFGSSSISEEKKIFVEQSYEQLEAQFNQSNNLYMAGNSMTIADLSIIATIPTLRHLHEINSEKYPKFLAWIKRMEKLPYYNEINQKGANIMIELSKTKMEENKQK